MFAELSFSQTTTSEPQPTNKDFNSQSSYIAQSSDSSKNLLSLDGAGQPSAGDVNEVPTSSEQCDVITHEGCNVRGFERCRAGGVCVCLEGYVRRFDTGQCVGKLSSSSS